MGFALAHPNLRGYAVPQKKRGYFYIEKPLIKIAPIYRLSCLERVPGAFAQHAFFVLLGIDYRKSCGVYNILNA